MELDLGHSLRTCSIAPKFGLGIMELFAGRKRSGRLINDLGLSIYST